METMVPGKKELQKTKFSEVIDDGDGKQHRIWHEEETNIVQLPTEAQGSDVLETAYDGTNWTIVTRDVQPQTQMTEKKNGKVKDK